MGVSTESGLGLDKDRNSDPTLETRIKDGDLKQIKELNEEKRKSARRKEFIMAELLETERSYVKVYRVDLIYREIQKRAKFDTSLFKRNSSKIVYLFKMKIIGEFSSKVAEMQK